MLTQILCAIDDAPHSETAAEFAIDLARQLSAKLVFHMANPAVLPSPRGAPVYLWSDDYIRSYLDEAFRRAKQAGVSEVTCETERANKVADSIVSRADLHGADFIVVGASGQARLVDLFRRPVSRLVTEMANCPVLVVRHVRLLRRRQDSLSYRQAA
jgi:nucleotide-binding universal stress UspA family protein